MGPPARAVRRAPSDVASRVLDSPLGPLLLASTEVGLARVAFAREDHAKVLDELSRVGRSEVPHTPAGHVAALSAWGVLENAARQIGEYFERRRTSFELALDLRLSSGFRRRVLDQVSRIPYGATASYAEIADAACSPRAVRAVGSACATNPIPIVVPCHRVIRSDCTIGNYGCGAVAKGFLLNLEAPGRPGPGGPQDCSAGASAHQDPSR